MELFQYYIISICSYLPYLYAYLEACKIPEIKAIDLVVVYRIQIMARINLKIDMMRRK